MQTSSQTKTTPTTSAEQHMQAAELCNKAATEHNNAAKCHITGDHNKAAAHAKTAHDTLSTALDLSKQAISSSAGSTSHSSKY